MAAPSNPNRSELDQTQILQRAFDESTDRLRTDSVINIGSASIAVDIQYTTDSIQIGDPNTSSTLKINSNGSIDANVVVDATTGDNIMSVGTSNATTSGTKNVIKVDSTGTQSTYSMNSIVPVAYDSIYPSYPTSSVEVYVYKQSAATVATVTVTYVDSTKAQIVSVVRT